MEDTAEATVRAADPAGAAATALAAAGIRVMPLSAMGDDAVSQSGVERLILSERVAVERRTGARFLQGIIDKTLFAHAIELGERFDVAVLLIEGDLASDHRAFHPQAVRGALTSMALVYGLTVLTTPNLEESVALIAMMARQEQGGVPEISLVPKRKAVDLADMQRRVAEMLPGCGMHGARNLLHHFGSLRRIAEADEAALCQAPGIGAKRAAEIHRVLNDDYRAIDTEQRLEDAIVEAPTLLFPDAAETPRLLARQQALGDAHDRRRVVDLVFQDDASRELILVELKLDALTADHETQLRGYLNSAPRTKRLAPLLTEGYALRGLLATATACEYEPQDPRIVAHVVAREAVIDVLARMREQRLRGKLRRG